MPSNLAMSSRESPSVGRWTGSVGFLMGGLHPAIIGGNGGGGGGGGAQGGAPELFVPLSLSEVFAETVGDSDIDSNLLW